MIAVVTHRVSGSVRTCSSLSQTLWPPNSSDLNPVDYAIWGALQQMVYHRQSLVSVDELKRAIVEAWQKLPQSFIDNSVGEWRRRLDAFCDRTADTVVVF